MNYKLSIVVPVFNKLNFTLACLEDLRKLPNDHEIVVVDNGSTDDTSNCLSEIKDSRFLYIRNAENQGFAKACNYGFTSSSGKHVMFLNNDIRVEKDHETWTQPIIEILDTDQPYLVGPTIGVLNEKLDFIQETNKFVGNHWYMSGWNITSSRDTWHKLILPGDIGPFSTEFGLAYFEDTDLSFRARSMNPSLGFHIQSVPVIHFGRVTSKSVGLSALYKPAQDKFKAKWASWVR